MQLDSYPIAHTAQLHRTGRGNSASVSLWFASPPVAPVVRPCPAVDKAVSQVRCAIRAVAHVHSRFTRPVFLLTGYPSLNVPENAVTVPGNTPNDCVTTNFVVPSVNSLMYTPLCVTDKRSHGNRVSGVTVVDLP